MFTRKTAILFIHGFVGGIYDFDDLPNTLELYKKFDVYTFTLPGHEKMIVRGVKYNEWIKSAEKQIEFLINNKYKNIYVIGHSMGGVIASHLASKYKEVKKLVLVAPAFKYFCFVDGKINIKNINSSIKSIPDLFKNIGLERVLGRITKTPIPTMLEFTKLVSAYDKSIKNVTCPILTIRGKADNVVPIESTDYVYNENKSISHTLVNIDKVTHDCFRGKRNDEVKELITEFLIKKPNKERKIINI